MESSETGIFIKAVKRFPCLYNPKHIDYKDMEIRRNAWLEVAEVCGFKDEIVTKVKWKRLRDYYKDRLQKTRTSTGQQGKKIKRWSYMDQMDFLKSTILLSSTQSNLDIDKSDHSEEEAKYSKQDSDNEIKNNSSYDSETEAIKFIEMNYKKKPEPQQLKVTKNVRRKYLPKKMPISKQSNKQVDSIDLFFQSIAETVKKLPPLSRNKIKMEVSNLVFKEEQNSLQCQLSPHVCPNCHKQNYPPQYQPNCSGQHQHYSSTCVTPKSEYSVSLRNSPDQQVDPLADVDNFKY